MLSVLLDLLIVYVAEGIDFLMNFAGTAIADPSLKSLADSSASYNSQLLYVGEVALLAVCWTALLRFGLVSKNRWSLVFSVVLTDLIYRFAVKPRLTDTTLNLWLAAVVLIFVFVAPLLRQICKKLPDSPVYFTADEASEFFRRYSIIFLVGMSMIASFLAVFGVLTSLAAVPSFDVNAVVVLVLGLPWLFSPLIYLSAYWMDSDNRQLRSSDRNLIFFALYGYAANLVLFLPVLLMSNAFPGLLKVILLSILEFGVFASGGYVYVRRDIRWLRNITATVFVLCLLVIVGFGASSLLPKGSPVLEVQDCDAYAQMMADKATEAASHGFAISSSTHDRNWYLQTYLTMCQQQRTSTSTVGGGRQ